MSRGWNARRFDLVELSLTVAFAAVCASIATAALPERLHEEATDLERAYGPNTNSENEEEWIIRDCFRDRVGGVYNRLVLWDAKMIHTASSYEGLSGSDATHSRLVQLFFFSIQ